VIWDHSIPFTPENSEETLASLPSTPAVFQLRCDEPGSEPYLGKTANLQKRLQRLLLPASPDSKRLNLRERTRTIEYMPTGSDFENRLLLYRVLRETFPHSFRKRMKLIPSALVKIGWENEYPRAYLTRRLSRIPPFQTSGKSGAPIVCYGPFASKSAASKFLNDALDLFKSRRCTFNIHPDSTFPGCMYSEMKMCLAPCYGGCTRDEYIKEVERVQQYLDTHAESLVSELAAEREAASAQLEFEKAASIHERIEKVKAPWNGVPELVGRLDLLSAVIVQRSSLGDHVSLFLFREGLLHGPVQFSVQGMMHPNPGAGSTSLFAHPHVAEPVPLDAAKVLPKAKPQNLESRVAETLAAIETRKPERGEVADHLALLKRWYYRKTHKGEIFLTHSGELPLRRIVRGISRVFRGESEEQAKPLS